MGRPSFSKPPSAVNEFLPGGGLEGSTFGDFDSSAIAESSVHESSLPSASKKEASEIGEYVSEESQMSFYANIHFAFENIRNSIQNQADTQEVDDASAPNKSTTVDSTPRVLVIGPQDSGKTSLCKVLVAYDLKRGNTPVLVNLDPLEPVFCAPGGLSVSVISDILDVEQGWGSSSFTGPAVLHSKQPHVRFFGLDDPFKNHEYYNEVVHSLAQTCESRLENDSKARQSGIYIDTPSALVAPENQEYGYKIIQHIVKEFSANVILVVGNEKLYSNVKKLFNAINTRNSATGSSQAQVTIVKVPKSGGVVDRNPEFMVSVQSRLINEYFYGTTKQPLSPFTVTADYSSLTIYRIAETKSSNTAPFALENSDAKKRSFSSITKETKISETSKEGSSSSEASDSKENDDSAKINKSNDDKDKDGDEANTTGQTVGVSNTEASSTASTEQSTPAPSRITISNSDDESAIKDNDDIFDIYDIKSESKSNYLIKLEPSSIVQNGLLAVLNANVDDPLDVISAAPVLCFVHVVETDDNRRKMRILMPTHGRLPNKPFVLGDFRYHD